MEGISQMAGMISTKRETKGKMPLIICEKLGHMSAWSWREFAISVDALSFLSVVF
jgi:hypothetical protein